MTRKEQIEKIARELVINEHGEEVGLIDLMVRCAEWADANNKDVEIQFELTKKNKALEAKLASAVEALSKLGLQCLNTGMYGPMKISPGNCTCSTCNARNALAKIEALE